MHYQENGAIINLWERNGYFSQRWQCESFLGDRHSGPGHNGPGRHASINRQTATLQLLSNSPADWRQQRAPENQQTACERQRSQQARENELERQRQNDLALLQFDKRRLIARQEQARQEELLRNQICAVEEENKQAVQHIQSIKLSAVPVERHKIEESSDYGRLGDAVQVHASRLLLCRA